jgi:peroxiredoxin
MVPTLFLLGCVLVPGQRPSLPPGRDDWPVRPQLTPGQEFVYVGTFRDDTIDGAVPFSRAYRVETRVLVLDVSRPATAVAVCTVLRPRDLRPGPPATPGTDGPVVSVRLERCLLGERGQLTADPGVGLAVPLDGPPALEVGAFFALPGDRLSLNQSWVAAEPGRPAHNWRVEGTEPANGALCLKIVGEQKTDDWDRPRLDRLAWRRQDTVWLAPRVGLAYKVERVVEKRAPGRDEPIRRTVLRYGLESCVPYSGERFDERRQEVAQALGFAAAAAPLLPTPGRNGAPLAALANRIAFHLDREPPTPYREAILEVRRRVEAARRGEVPVTLPADVPPEPGVAGVGETAPDFVAPDFRSPASANLKRWLGRPVLLVFFSPTSPTADRLLPFAQRLADANAGRLTVVGLAMSDDAELVRERTAQLNVRFPLLNGTGLRRSYAVEATPKMVLLDGAGVVRGAYVGWGNEVPQEVVEELSRWLPRK